MHILVLLITALESEESFENDNQVARLETQNSGIVDIGLLRITLLSRPSVSRLLCNLAFSEMEIEKNNNKSFLCLSSLYGWLSSKVG